MHGYVVIASALVGLLVGATGAGGGALMTPMLILLFSVKPSTAISSDLVSAVAMRPVGAAVHFRRGTVNLRLVAWLSVGSVPAAFLGTYVPHLLASGATLEHEVQLALGGALLIGAAAMLLRYLLDRLDRRTREAKLGELVVRPAPTIAIGVVGGFVVGVTSVGAGSLMIVLLLFLYPTLAAGRLVGSDLAQAMPLTAAAALGALLFGHVAFPLTLSIVLGSVPAVFVGALCSSRFPDRLLRPVIGTVITLSGLKYVGVGVDGLAWSFAAVVVALALGGVLVKVRGARPAGGDAPLARRASEGRLPVAAD